MDYQQLISEFDSKIASLELRYDDIIEIAEQGIVKTEQYLRILRNRVLKHGFKSKAEEIHFFKHTKPHVFSRFLYYLHIFKIESKRPRSSSKFQIKYLNHHIDAFQVFFNEHIDFYHYYRRGSTNLDEEYFTRHHNDPLLHAQAFHYIIDEAFLSLQDINVATFTAYDMLIIYLQKEIDIIEQSSAPNKTGSLKLLSSNLTWTRSKTELIELIYALQSSGAINSGTAEIKKLATVFERVFNIDLGNYYHTFSEIRGRKYSKTKFLDKLTEVLERRFEDLDE